MHAHFFIQQIPALKKGSDAVGSGFLDTITDLDIYQGITRRAGFKFHQSVLAHYSLRDDGGLRVVNRGYDPQKREWRKAEGKAYFMKSPKIGYLKVSFFGPFYGSYVIFALDEADYRYSFVSGADKSYLWLLARTPRAEDEVLDKFIKKADMLGFDTAKLIYVEHGARCRGTMQKDGEKDARDDQRRLAIFYLKGNGCKRTCE